MSLPMLRDNFLFSPQHTNKLWILSWSSIFFKKWIIASLHALLHRDEECNERRKKNEEREKQNKNYTTLRWTSWLNVHIHLQTVPMYPEFVYENRSGEPHISRVCVCITSKIILYIANFLEYGVIWCSIHILSASYRRHWFRFWINWIFVFSCAVLVVCAVFLRFVFDDTIKFWKKNSIFSILSFF